VFDEGYRPVNFTLLGCFLRYSSKSFCDDSGGNFDEISFIPRESQVLECPMTGEFVSKELFNVFSLVPCASEIV
jgi:hypothetical protein